ncbi:MAG: DUF4301 family protein [Bacteroidales bacterium]|nr:DUF4301 family protein [Bacteroidales bacterium]
MLSKEDLSLLEKKGISPEKVDQQLQKFKEGFPFLKLYGAATTELGILSLNESETEHYIRVWDKYVHQDKKILKFVPASGAASRMFKNLFEFLSASYNEPSTEFEKKFFNNIDHFAFFNDLNAVCLKNEKKDIKTLIADGCFKTIVDNLLNEKGLNYGSLPKGLLKFHTYPKEIRASIEEHLVEGALYAVNGMGIVNLHFTVSEEHKDMFEKMINEVKGTYEKKFGVKFNVSFSTQKQSTDTIAADSQNNPFRSDGKLVFRPGGHGALIENLNEMDADIIFIKNIDNVVPDKFKDLTVKYKQVIAGVLVSLQQKIYTYSELLESGKYTHEQLLEMLHFLRYSLFTRNPEVKDLEDSELALYLKRKFKRPIRVCGMVKNVGEPGGGPFLAYNNDGTYSLQILESSQIDMNDSEAVKIFKSATHFNPVDLVCAVKDKNGENYNLLNFVDNQTGFISLKSKNGKDLKALELPGLWNGAMSDWNTVFVEVPLETFNPVKTVNDLLRTEHQ